MILLEPYFLKCTKKVVLGGGERRREKSEAFSRLALFAWYVQSQCADGKPLLDFQSPANLKRRRSAISKVTVGSWPTRKRGATGLVNQMCTIGPSRPPILPCKGVKKLFIFWVGGWRRQNQIQPIGRCLVHPHQRQEMQTKWHFASRLVGETALLY